MRAVLCSEWGPPGSLSVADTPARHRAAFETLAGRKSTAKVVLTTGI